MSGADGGVGSRRAAWVAQATTALALGAVAAGLLQLERTQTARALSDAGARLEAEARQRALEVARWRRAREGEASILRYSQSVAALLSGQVAGAGPLRAGRILDDLVARLGYAGAMAVDPAGLVRGARPAGQPGPPPAALDAVRIAVASGEATWTSLLVAGGQRHLYLAVPVEGGAGVAGAVLLRIDPAAGLLPLLAEGGDEAAASENLLVRREGERVRSLTSRPRGPDGVLLVRGTDDDEVVAVRAALGRGGPLRGPDHDGARVVAGVAGVPGTDWLVVAQVPEDVLAAPARQAFRLGVAGVAVVAVGLLGLGWRRGRRRERDLERQAEAAEQRHLAGMRHFETAGALSHDVLLLLDGEGRIVEANDRAVEAYGWSRDELLRLRIGDLRSRETRDDVPAMMERARRAGGLRFETEHVRRDGSPFPVEVSTRTLVILGRTYWQSAIRDISDRRRAEAAARLGELKFRTAFLEAGFGVLLVGRDGRIVEHNEAMRRMLDRPGDQLTGLPVTDLVHAEQREEAGRQFQELMAGRCASIGGERRYLRADGAAVAVQLRATAIPDEAGRPAFALGIVEDVSRQRWMEAQLRLSDRMASIGALAAGVAHEINNPLSYIASNVRFALDGTGAGDVPPAEVAQALREALEGAARVKEIVRDLRMLSRAEDSRDEACDLAGVVATVANMVRHQLRDRAALVVDVPAGLVAAGSAGRLGQVFLNLLINAAQAIEPGAPQEHAVAVRARAGGEGQLVVEVTDTGHGIAPEHLARVFDPFFTTKPVGLGTGLGLSICHGIVTSLGGDIRATSAPGRGTTFHLQLPARPAMPAAAGAGAASGAAASAEVPAATHLAREAACPAS